MSPSPAAIPHFRIILPPWKLLPLPADIARTAPDPLLNSCNGLLGSMPSQSQIFGRLQNCDPSADSAEWEVLRHYLSAFIDVPPIDFDKVIAAEQHEARIYQRWRLGLPSLLRLEDILRLNAVTTGSSGAMRRTPAYLASHDGDTHLPMVNWREAHQRMAQLPTLLESGDLGHGLLSAVRILALINNAHAFSDGNGRLGRFLFHLCLHRSGLPLSSYLPLKSLAVLSRGSYEIRLREVILFGRWDGLIAYHCHVVRLIHQWRQTSATAHSESEC